VKVSFADPRSPWHRGINENTNGRLRQYLPRSEDLSVYSQDELDAIAWKLNTRPRKSLVWKCSAGSARLEMPVWKCPSGNAQQKSSCPTSTS
jgi:IS30 family transposase